MSDLRMTKFFSVFSKQIQDEIFDFCKRISSAKADVYIFLARKAAVFCDCLEELGQIHLDGYVTSDRSLDIEGEWLFGKDVVIIDDAVVSGTTIYYIIQKLEQYGAKSISVQLLTINNRWFNPELLKNAAGESFVYPVYNKHPDNLCVKLCNDIVQAISLVPRPYDIDFPLYKSIIIPENSLNRILVLNNWFAHDIRTERQRDNSIVNVSLIPNKQELVALSATFGLDITHNCIVKIRVYGRLIDKAKRSFSLRISPMIIFNEMDIDTVQSIFDRIVAYSNNPSLFKNWSSTSQLRFLQFYYSNHLAMIWHNHIRHIVPTLDRLEYSYRNLSFLFPEKLIQPIEALCASFVAMPSGLNVHNTTKVRERNPQSVYRSIDPISINARLYEPFLDMYHEKELPCRELVLREGKRVFGIPEYKHIVNRLNEGLSFQDLKERLRDCVNDYDIEQKISEFIDRSIDAGIIVPIIQQEGHSVFRAYRHGEDVLFGSREELMYRKMLSLFAEQAGSTNGITRIEIEKIIVLFTKIGLKEKMLNPYTSNFSSEPLDKNGQQMRILRVKPYLKGPVSLLGTARQHRPHNNIPYITNERKSLWFTNVLLQNGSLKPNKNGQKYEVGEVDDTTEEDFALLTEQEQTFVQNFSELTGRISNPNCNTGISFSDTDWARIAVTLTLPDTATAVAAEMDIFYNDYDPTSYKDDLDYSIIRNFSNSRMYESIHSAVMKIESFTEQRGKQLISKVIFPSKLEQRTWLGYFSDELNNPSDENNAFLQSLFYEEKVWAYLMQGVVDAIYLLLLERYKKHNPLKTRDETKRKKANLRMQESFAALKGLRQEKPDNTNNASLLFQEYDRIAPHIESFSVGNETDLSNLINLLQNVITETDEIAENIKEIACDILGERGKVHDILRYTYAIHVNLEAFSERQRMRAQERINYAYMNELKKIDNERKLAVSKGQHIPNKTIRELPQKFKPLQESEGFSPGIWYIASGSNIAKQVAAFAMNITVLLHYDFIDCRVTVFERLSYDYCIRSNTSQNAEYHCNQFNTLMEKFKEKVLFPSTTMHSSTIIHVCAKSSKKEPVIAKEIQNAVFKGTNSFQQNDSYLISGPSISKTDYLITEFDCIVDRKERMMNNYIVGINKDLFDWATSSKMYHMAIGSSDDYFVLLSQALGPNEDLCYKSSFTLMKAIWDNHPILGLAPDYMLLAEREYSGSYYFKYRDHLTHMFKVFLLGLYMYENHSFIKCAIQNRPMTDEQFLSTWIITALYHDVGYLIETEDGCWDSKEGKEFITRFDDSLSLPMAHLFSGKMSPETERVLQEDSHLSPAKASGQTRVEEKLISFAGFGKTVRLSLKDDSNPVKAYYEFVSRKHNDRVYYDHGIVSACLLLFMCDSVGEYMKKSKELEVPMFPEHKELRDNYVDSMSQIKDYSEMAAKAIALHNIKKEWSEEEANELNRQGVTIGEFQIPLKDEPIAYLLRLCDELQCWDRQYFTSPLRSLSQLSADNMRIDVNNKADILGVTVLDPTVKKNIESSLVNLLVPGINQCVFIM